MMSSGHDETYNNAHAAICLFFFFQAEDGIRDVAVTGVQTCALPISRFGSVAPPITKIEVSADGPGDGIIDRREPSTRYAREVKTGKPESDVWPHENEIGRASCRERV